MPDATDELSALRSFLDASPSPFHAVASGIARLEAAGFTALDETEAWSHVGRAATTSPAAVRWWRGRSRTPPSSTTASA